MVSERWLATWITALILIGLACVYLTLCLLFYQGQWQLIFHPSHIIDHTPADAGLKYEDIRFDATETGHLQLAGWFIAADANAKYADDTALICHDASGSISNTIPLADQLHTLGINVFTFDYRGFGNSDWAKPHEPRVYQDSDAALRYLLETRHIPAGHIVLYGIGVGAAACAHAAQAQPVGALILENPIASMLSVALTQQHTMAVPLHLLFRERFETASMLQQLSTPKLFISAPGNTRPSAAEVHNLFIASRAPKIYREEPSRDTDQAQNQQSVLSRFLDEYLPAK